MHKILTKNFFREGEKFKEICGNLSKVSGGFNAAPRSTMDEEKDYQDMICLGRKGGQSLRGEGP